MVHSCACYCVSLISDIANRSFIKTLHVIVALKSQYLFVVGATSSKSKCQILYVLLCFSNIPYLHHFNLGGGHILSLILRLFSEEKKLRSPHKIVSPCKMAHCQRTQTQKNIFFMYHTLRPFTPKHVICIIKITTPMDRSYRLIYRKSWIVPLRHSWRHVGMILCSLSLSSNSFCVGIK